ncbi:unnamed protein product [Cylicocyclus nassatus]|uniref:HMG box domain-containing protein n=1 Tax=Cylicocyclus nassatus TaxID=53992 RepID=A0AA36M4G5_CYLNA|nr:unnamed protein product [Cylicocyclus nassatus]
MYRMPSSQTSQSGSRAASPEDENGKPRSQSPAESLDKTDKYADLRRRSAQAFTIFANEERDRLLKTRPDLPMGLVTRMMVEKWRSFDNDAKKPYFDALRASPPLKTVKNGNDCSSEIIPPKKWRPAASYTQPIFTVGNQPIQNPEQSGRVIVVQGKLGASVAEVVKPPSSISASIAQALGMTIITPQHTSIITASAPSMPSTVRSSSSRSKLHHGTTTVMSQSNVSNLSSASDPLFRSATGSYGFANSQQALDMFYLALCEPAFPQPNEPPLTPYPANYCYEAYLRMTSGQ